ncbi:MAG: hypothetical protein WD424_07300 [Paenibacillaceae bacterium]
MAVAKTRRVLSIVLALGLLFSSISISTAESVTPKKTSIGQVNIKQNSRIELTNVQMIPSNNQQTVAFTIRIVNNETTGINFYDYWVKLKLSNGSIIPVKPFDSKADDVVAPQTTKSYTFYGVVNQATKYADISLQLIQWDFSQPDFTRVLGTIKVPGTYDPSVGDNSLTVDGSKVMISFKNMSQSKISEEIKVNFEAVFRNEGQRAVVIPTYKYYLQTEDNLVYELTADKTSVQVQPKATASIKLKSYIPEQVDINNARFFIAQFDEQSKIEIPLFLTKIDLKTTVSNDAALTIGTEKSVLIDEKSYSVKLESVQELPWEDENIISAMITITNKTKEALPIPEFSGVFSLDGVEVSGEATKIINLDSGIGIPAQSKIRLSMFSKLPYSYKYSNIKFELFNNIKDGEETTKEALLSYNVPKTVFKQFTPVLMDKTFETSTIGKAASYKVKSLNTYQSNSTDIYDVLLEVQNNELRSANLSKLTGYFRSSNGTLYPVTITEVKDKVSPSARVLLSVTAKIPEWANTNDLRLVLGELDEENKVYYSAAEFRLPGESTPTVDGNLKDKNIYPYTLSINSININLSNNADVKFQYTLEKTSEYELTPDGHTLLMELVDGEVAYTKEFVFETDLKLGTQLSSMVAEMGIDNPSDKINNIDGFIINIYDQYKGHKKLLASRKVYSIFIK